MYVRTSSGAGTGVVKGHLGQLPMSEGPVWPRVEI